MDQEQMWIAAALDGDTDAFGELVKAYENRVYNLTYRMLGNAEEAEDAAQEAFIRAYQKLHMYDVSRKFSTWLFTIANNYCIDRLRRRRFSWLSLDAETISPAALMSHQPGPEKCVMQSEYEAEIQGLLEDLSPKQRSVVILRYWYELSYVEIAETTGESVSAVKSCLFRARQKLANILPMPEQQQRVLAIA